MRERLALGAAAADTDPDDGGAALAEDALCQSASKAFGIDFRGS